MYRGSRCRPIATFLVAVLALVVGISAASAKTKPKPYPVKVFSVAQIAPLSGQNAALGVWDSKGISPPRSS